MLRNVLLSVVLGMCLLTFGGQRLWADTVFGGPDISISPQSSQWSWDGFQLSLFRSAITDPSNFGPAGTVATGNSVVFLPTVDSASLAGINVFVSAWWANSDSAPYENAVKDWFMSGGSLLLLQDDPDHDGIGALLGIPSFSSTGSPSNGGGPLMNGPFGAASDVTQFGNTGALDPNDVLSHHGSIGATNADGQVTAAYWSAGQYAAGAGSLVVLADVDMLTSFYGNAQYSPPNENGIFGLNTVAFLDSQGAPAPVPEPASALLAVIGGLGVAFMARRRKPTEGCLNLNALH